MIKEYMRNPLSLWVKYVWQKKRLEKKYKSESLKIGYMSFVDHIIPGNYNTIYEYVTLKNVVLGDFTYIAKHSEIMHTTIGKFCSIGEKCKIGLGLHPTDLISTHPIFYSTRQQAQISFTAENNYDEYKEIHIGHDVWIGTSVMIMDGMTIGNGAIIAAGSIVTHDVPAYAIVAGIPAKVIRYRFSKDECKMLQNINWWDKDIEWLQEHSKEFLNTKIFLQKHTT